MNVTEISRNESSFVKFERTPVKVVRIQQLHPNHNKPLGVSMVWFGCHAPGFDTGLFDSLKQK